MAKQRVFTTDLGVVKGFPELLAKSIAGVTEDVIKDNISKIASSGRFAKFIKTKKDPQVTNFRTILESFAPVIYFVDYNLLNIELKKIKDKAIQLRTAAPKGVFEEEIEALSFRPDEGLDEVIETIITGVKKGVTDFIKSSSPKKIKYKELAQQFVTAGQFGLGSTYLKNRYPFRLVGRLGSTISEAFVFRDYDEASEKLGRRINKNVADSLKTIGVTKLKNVLILGHAAARSTPSEDEEVFYASTPKLFQKLIDKTLDAALQTPKTIPSVEVLSVEDQALQFLVDTSQLGSDVSVQVDKDFANNFLKIFIGVGGQILRGEAAYNNNLRSANERLGEGQNSVILEKLRKYYEVALEEFNSTIDKEVAKVLVNSIKNVTINAIKSKDSPSLVSYLEDSLLNILKTGKVLKPYSKNLPGKEKIKIRSSAPVIKNKTSSKVNYKKLTVPSDSFVAPRPPRSVSTLPNLMMQLNSALQDQIKRNMGTGNRRDVLNYRTGRFAESVKVEKLSESRQGMITAFYSYMKYPYATFSQGGRQEIPRSRDPKLLISKSIREIAATLVGNRMRAVSL